MDGNSSELTRRTCVETGAALLAGGLLAGCTGGGDDSSDGTTTDEGGSSTPATTTDTADETSAGAGTDGEETSAAAGTAGTETSPTGTASGEIPALSADAKEYLSDARSYSGGGPADYTGQSEVSVENGAGTRGMAFDPAAIAVSPGTTVVWQWTGRGGEHDVVAVDGSFESELVESSTKTFSHTFEESGEWTYNCSEHEDKGMKGVVVVV